MSHVESCHDKSNHVARSMSTWTSEKSHAISIKSDFSSNSGDVYQKDREDGSLHFRDLRVGHEVCR